MAASGKAASCRVRNALMAAALLIAMSSVSPAANITEMSDGLMPCVNVAGSTGGNGDYPTLGAAFTALNANGTQGGNAITVTLTCDTVETASAVLHQPAVNSWSSLQIAPVGPRTVSGAVAGALIDLNGADNVTIDGLNASGNALTISNTNTGATSSTIRFINGASGNTVVNCSVLGSSTGAVAAASGTILFSPSTAGAGANNGNTVSNNNIGPAGANFPTKGVMSLGSPAPDNNTQNVINNNNIFDFFNAGLDVAGISLQANTTTVTVSNNRLYQTAPRVFTAAVNYRGIVGDIGNGDGVATITGNIIGFGAANGTGLTTLSGNAQTVTGISLFGASKEVATSVQNNTISGISNSTSGDNFVFGGIFVGTGRYDVGNVIGNSVGSLDGSSTITLTSSSNGGVFGIFESSTSSNTIANNKIGAITINGTGVGTHGFVGISVDGFASAVVTLTNNQIGAAGAAAITDTQVGGYEMIGLSTYGTRSVLVTGNTIRNLSGNSTSVTWSVVGMFLRAMGTTSPSLISQNTIHSLSNNSPPGGFSSILGLYCEFSAGPANVVERNFVHSLVNTSSDNTAGISGIEARGGTATYRNNMVRLGFDPAGASITAGYSMAGMSESAGTNSFYFNSIYIGGTVVGAGHNTFAFGSGVSAGTSGYVGNIFWNARSTDTGTGHNYAITVSSGLFTSDHNDLAATGTRGLIGRDYNDYPTLAVWQAHSGQDLNSLSVDPLFIAPTGTAETVNLHISSRSPMIGAALPVAGVTNDFDDETRDLTAPDIGADEILGPAATPTPTPTPTATTTPSPTATIPPPSPSATATIPPPSPSPTATIAPTPSPSATLVPSPTASASPSATPVTQTLNLSTRMRVETGDRVGIGGFIITGNEPKTVLLRAIGPSLIGSGISNVLVDPVLELHGPGGSTTITNNNWRDTQEAEIQATGISPVNDLEPAILATLDPGTFTATVHGNGATAADRSGVALVEVYDLDATSDSKLANLSTRAFVSTGSDIVIAGFLLSDGNGTDRIVVRGMGPSLAPPFPANAVLADPTLQLRDGNGALILANNDWQDNAGQAAELTASGLAPSNALESAIAATLPPGAYTALLAGTNNGVGIGLVEVYDLGP